MKKLLLIASALAVSLPLFAQNLPLYLAGDFNGWAPNGTVMADQGGGVWSVALSGLTPGIHAFKVTEGDWSWNTPTPSSGANAWLVADGSGNATVSIDLNTYSDGWVVNQNRINVGFDPGSWYAVGAFNGFNNADPNLAMSSLGGGIYEVQYIMAAPGTYGFKATSGGWNYQIGSDGRSQDAGTLAFTTVAPNQQVDMFVNAMNGTLSVVVVPEPSTIALLGLGGLFVMRRIVRRK